MSLSVRRLTLALIVVDESIERLILTTRRYLLNNDLASFSTPFSGIVSNLDFLEL